MGNLEVQFSKEIKKQCYLSTLDSKDVDICKIKDFENVVQFDYLENANEPKFKHGGDELEIAEIVKKRKQKANGNYESTLSKAKGQEKRKQGNKLF